MMKTYALDANCFIDAFSEESPAYEPMQKILKAYHLGLIRITISRHTLDELPKQKHIKNLDKVLSFVKPINILPHYPIGFWSQQVTSWNKSAGSWDDSRENQRKQMVLQKIAKSGTDIRDRGAYIDALLAKSDAFITSDGDLAKKEPSEKIRAEFGLRVITPIVLANMIDFELILQFWFHSLNDATPIDKKSPPAKLWFNGGKAFDEEIRQKFLRDYLKARVGEYKEWESTARGCLALVIIFDQFSRNMFRGTPQAFETDALALELSQRSIKDGKEKELMLIERMFLYMPFMHAESLPVQELGVKSFELLIEESRAKLFPNTSYFEYNLDYAKRHRDIIAQFGRFPHRNAVLQRPSTVEETAFLNRLSYSF